MSLTLKVSLDKSVTPFAVVVDEGNNGTQMRRDPLPQTIVWQLTGDAASGNFVPLAAAEPGFAWLSQPPPGAGIFSDLHLEDNGNKLKVQDLNPSAASTGEWFYRLRVSVQGTVYHSGSLSLGGTIRDPIIVNR